MRATHAILIGILVFAGAAWDIPAARAQAVDPGAGVIPDEGAPAGPQPQITCTLLITPSVVTNGQVFTMQVNYSPSISGTWKEKFIFNWPSKAADFDEKTVRIKSFIGYGTVSGSFEVAVAPTALNIEGTFRAKVRVPGVCSATAQMTVNNP